MRTTSDTAVNGGSPMHSDAHNPSLCHARHLRFMSWLNLHRRRPWCVSVHVMACINLALRRSRAGFVSRLMLGPQLPTQRTVAHHISVGTGHVLALSLAASLPSGWHSKHTFRPCRRSVPGGAHRNNRRFYRLALASGKARCSCITRMSTTLPWAGERAWLSS